MKRHHHHHHDADEKCREYRHHHDDPRGHHDHDGGHDGAEDDRSHRRRSRGRGSRRDRHGHGSRAPRGDVRAAVLVLLSEEPMHGYQLMRAIADRTGGRWEPSPGAIYPTINQLEDEGLVSVSADSGRRLVTLTDAGREQAAADRESRPDPFASDDDSEPQVDLRSLLSELHSAVRQLARSGDTAQREAAAGILSDARKAVYLLLAEGPAPSAD